MRHVATVSNHIQNQNREAGTPKAHANADHIEKERWSPSLVYYDWYAFCQALKKGIGGEDWEDKEMSRAMGVQKPQEAQKAKAL